jgi:hypothetical protein
MPLSTNTKWFKSIASLLFIVFLLSAAFSLFLFNNNDQPLKKTNFLVVVVFSNLFVLMLFWLIIKLLAGKSLSHGVRDFIIGDEGGYSLFRLQAVLWAIIIMGSQFAILFSIWLGHGFNSLYLYQPVFSESALWLLGLSLTSCLTVKGITVERMRSEHKRPEMISAVTLVKIQILGTIIALGRNIKLIGYEI